MATANAVEDGVGEGGFVDDGVPRLNRKLTGDDGGPPAADEAAPRQWRPWLVFGVDLTVVHLEMDDPV